MTGSPRRDTPAPSAVTPAPPAVWLWVFLAFSWRWSNPSEQYWTSHSIQTDLFTEFSFFLFFKLVLVTQFLSFPILLQLHSVHSLSVRMIKRFKFVYLIKWWWWYFLLLRWTVCNKEKKPLYSKIAWIPVQLQSLISGDSIGYRTDQSGCRFSVHTFATFCFSPCSIAFFFFLVGVCF